MNILICCTLLTLTWTAYAQSEKKIVCYYNARGVIRGGQAEFNNNLIEPALQFCTHLIYGYASIQKSTNTLAPLYYILDVSADNYRNITALKKRYPNLKVLLSVGGNEDPDENHEKYLTLLENTNNRLAFVNSARSLLKTYNFDGLDLAWQFPETKPKKVRGKIRGFLSKIKHKVVGESVIDEKASDHKEQFTALVRDLKAGLRQDALLLSLSVLPNVNSSVYYDPRALAPHLDFITLQAFDFYTPRRNPKEADFSAPLYELVDRKYDENVDYQVRYWLQKGAPNNKVLLGISTFGRAWKMDEDSPSNGAPPLEIDGPAAAGPLVKEEGLLSYTEICTQLGNGKGQLEKVEDPTKRRGTYAFRLPDKDGNGGIWVSYEDPSTVGFKAAYAKAKDVGGVSLVDVTLDDFRGLCTGDRYPLLRAAKQNL